MNDYTAGEEAYKNGYAAGYKARMKDETTHCLFNNAVICNAETNNCECCGWNPDVSMNRLRRICKSMGIPVPERKEEKIAAE